MLMVLEIAMQRDGEDFIPSEGNTNCSSLRL